MHLTVQLKACSLMSELVVVVSCGKRYCRLLKDDVKMWKTGKNFRFFVFLNDKQLQFLNVVHSSLTERCVYISSKSKVYVCCKHAKTKKMSKNRLKLTTVSKF